MSKKISKAVSVVVLGAVLTTSSSLSAGAWAPFGKKNKGTSVTATICPGLKYDGTWRAETTPGKTAEDPITVNVSLEGEVYDTKKGEAILKNEFAATAICKDGEVKLAEAPTHNVKNVNKSTQKGVTSSKILTSDGHTITDNNLRISRVKRNKIRTKCQREGDVNFSFVICQDGQVIFILDSAKPSNITASPVPDTAKIFPHDDGIEALVKERETKSPSEVDESANRYNHVTRQITITYQNKESGKTLARVNIFVNFIFNPKTGEVECTSTSYTTDNQSQLKAELNTLNKSRKDASAYGKVEVAKSSNIWIDPAKANFNADCDRFGNTSFHYEVVE